MAVYEIDGQRFEVPDSVQGDQLTQTLTQISESLGVSQGETAAQNANGQTVSPASEVQARSAEDLTGQSNPFLQHVESFLIGAGKNLASFPRGVRQAFEKMNAGAIDGQTAFIEANYGEEAASNPQIKAKIIDLESRKAESESKLNALFAEQKAVDDQLLPLKKEFPVSTGAGEIAGLAAPSLLIPGSAATIPGRVGLGAISGGATGAIAPAQSLEHQDSNFGLGAALGGAGGVIVPAIAKVFSPLFRRSGVPPTTRVLNDDGTFTDDAISILKSSGETVESVSAKIKGEVDAAQVSTSQTGASQALTQKQLTAEQAERFNLFKELGIEPTKFNITQTVDDSNFQFEALKKSGQLTDLVEQQNNQIIGGIRDISKNTGGQSQGLSDGGSQVINAVNKRFIDEDEAISNLYKKAEIAAGQDKTVKLSKLAGMLRQEVPISEARGNVAKSIASALKNKGIVDNNFKAVGRIGPAQAERVRQVLNKLSQENPKQAGLIRGFKDALDEDVFRTQGESVFKEARAAKFTSESLRKIEKLTKKDRILKSVINDIGEGKIEPEQLIERVVLNKSANTRQLSLLKKFLHEGTEEQKELGVQAWNGVRQEVVESFLKKGVSGSTTNQTGEFVLSPANFSKAIDRVSPEKLKLLFSIEEMRALNSLRKISNLRVAKPATAQGDGPTSLAIKKATEKIPLIRDAVEYFTKTRAESKAVIPQNETIKAVEDALTEIAAPAPQANAAAQFPSSFSGGLAGGIGVQGNQ